MDDDNSSESGDDVIPPVNIRDKEPNINSVDYGFIKSGKSTGDGVLHTNNKSFRYYTSGILTTTSRPTSESSSKELNLGCKLNQT